LPEVNLWVVADGMGGYEAGNVASQMVVQALQTISENQSLNEFVNSIEDELIGVNHRILEYSDIMLEGRMLGSTVVTLAIKGRVGICLWAGDSRLYRFRCKRLEQLSRDHSEVEEQIQNGIISPEDAENHPELNVITRAIGAGSEIYIDINAFSTQVGDIFLLCSDGFYNVVSTEDMSLALANLPIDQAVEDLLQTVLDKRADDNVSVILVKGEPGKLPDTSGNDPD
jgi:serine/threonine protein phosphatase PrpC